MASIRKTNPRVPADGRGRVGSNPSTPTLADIFNGHSTRSAKNPQEMNPIDANFGDILGRLTAGSDDLIMQLLRALGFQQEAGLKGPQRDDWNKQLLNTLTNYLLTQDNRKYNESMRDEQRIFDSPTNQLARLMGAGVSRDSAIQMLSGGSQPIQSEAAPADQGIAPSESLKNGIDAALAPIQTAFDAISAVGSLVGLGFEIPQALEQIKTLKLSNQLSRQQLDGYNSASTAFGILNSIGASADSFGSAANAISAIQKAAAGGDSNALSFVNSGGLQSLSNNSYFASQALSHLYRSERSSSDYDKSFGLYVDQTEAETDFKRASKDNVVQATLNLQGEFAETAANTDFINAQKNAVQYSIAVMNEQAKLLRKQGKTEEAKQLELKARTLNTESLTKAQDLQNQYTEGVYNKQIKVGDATYTGLGVLTYGSAVQAYNDMKKFVYAKNTKIWESELKSLSMNYERLYNLCLVQNTFLSGAMDKYKDDPKFKDLMITCSALSQSGAFDYINTKINANKSDLIFGPADNQLTLKEFGL